MVLSQAQADALEFDPTITPEFHVARTNQKTCHMLFIDASGANWTCGRAQHQAGDHAAFLGDGTLACREGCKPIWRPTGNPQPAINLTDLPKRAVELITAASNRERDEHDRAEALLAACDLKNQQLASLHDRFARVNEPVDALRRSLQDEQRRRVAVRANLRDMLEDVARIKDLIEEDTSPALQDAFGELARKLNLSAKRLR